MGVARVLAGAALLAARADIPARSRRGSVLVLLHQSGVPVLGESQGDRGRRIRVELGVLGLLGGGLRRLRHCVLSTHRGLRAVEERLVDQHAAPPTAATASVGGLTASDREALQRFVAAAGGVAAAHTRDFWAPSRARYAGFSSR